MTSASCLNECSNALIMVLRPVTKQRGREREREKAREKERERGGRHIEDI